MVLRRSATSAVLPALLVSRLLIFGVAVAVLTFELSGTPLLSGLRTMLASWDAQSYLHIAQHGYPSRLDDRSAYLDAFLPGFPLLIRGAAFIIRDDVAAAWVVCLAGEAAGLWYVYKLVLAERDRGAAVFAVWLIALLPTAVFFSAPFTEAPFMAAAAASLYYARQGRTGAACIAAAAASAMRLTGLALLPALIVECLPQPGRQRRFSGVLLPLLIIPLPLLLYCLYMRLHTGDALALFDAQSSASFGHSVAPPWDGFAATWNTMATASDGETRSIFAREVAFGLLGLVACIAMWVSTRVPRSFALYCSFAWLLTASLTFWRSQPRYFLALFPAVIVVADLTRPSRASRVAVIAVSAALMAAATWIFAEGRWLG